jgi:hypothetical protein
MLAYAAYTIDGYFRTIILCHNHLIKNGSLIAALSSRMAICPSGVMVLSEVAHCAS